MFHANSGWIVFAQWLTFGQPIAFLLAIPAAAALMLYPARSRVLQTVRILLVASVILAIADPQHRESLDSGTLLVLVDRSQSMPPDAEQIQLDLIRRLNKEKKKNQKLKIVSFSESAAVESGTDMVVEVGSQSSRLGQAIRLALLSVPPGRNARMLVVSDGNFTHEDPVRLTSLAAARNIAIDYRYLARPHAGDLGIVHVQHPVTVDPREIFGMTAWIHSPFSQDVTVELTRSGKVISSGHRKVPAGSSAIELRDLMEQPQVGKYELKVVAKSGEGESPQDPIPENNRYRFLVRSDGRKPVLILTEKQNSPLEKLLENGGVPAKAFSPDGIQLDLATLSGYSGVIIEDVPHRVVGATDVGEIANWVSSAGGGVLLTGGQRSFGQGGYYKSALDPVLPVSMELRKEYRKGRIAMVLVLDRSGSMTMPVSGGKSKMDLANAASANVIDLLSTEDEIGVFAVDTAPHLILKLKPLVNKAAAKNRVLRIRSEGGGIYVYEGLKAAVGMLKGSSASSRHIILFSDAADSEQPGAYQQLLADCEKAGITCSVIALGTRKDSDADLLVDIANRGNGRVFFTTNAKELPELFAQDTFSVARSFIGQVTPLQATPGLRSILADWLGDSLDQIKSIGGYNLTYIKDKANLAITTLDENRAPLFAAWYVGNGRAAVYTGQVDGKFTGPIATWPDYPRLLNSIARWVGQNDNLSGSGFVVTQRIERGEHVVTMYLDPDPTKHQIKTAPQVQSLSAVAGNSSTVHAPVRMKWISPSRLEFRHPLEGDLTYLSTIVLPGANSGSSDKSLVSLAPVKSPYPAEFQPTLDSTNQDQNDNGLSILEELAKRTGGEQRLDVKGLWDSIPPATGYQSWATWCYLAGIVLLLGEVLERRTGYVGYFLSRLRIRRRASTSDSSRETGASTETALTPTTRRTKRRGFTRTRKTESDADAESASILPETDSEESTASASDSVSGSASTEQETVTDALAQARAQSRKRTRG